MGHLVPQQAPGEHVEELDSWTFQTVGHQAVPAIAEALGLPYIAQPTLGLARQQGVEYHSTAGRAPDDEVEDAARLIARAQVAWPELQAVCVGAILSNYQRCRMEAMYVPPCRRHGEAPEPACLRITRPPSYRSFQLRSSGLASAVSTVAVEPSCHDARAGCSPVHCRAGQSVFHGLASQAPGQELRCAAAILAQH